MTQRPRGPWDAGFDLQGHRGARGHVGENTWASFVRAVELGATTLEFDVRLTADGHVVVWHDEVLDRMIAPGDDAGLRGRALLDLTLEQVRKVEVARLADPSFPRQEPTPGAHILDLVEVLTRMRSRLPGVWANIEVKVDAGDSRSVERRDDLVDAVGTAIEVSGMTDRVIVHSFDWSVLRRASIVAPHLPRSALVSLRNLYAGPDALGGVEVGAGSTPWSRAGVLAGAVEVGAQALCPRFPWLPAQWEDDGTAGESLTVDRAFIGAAHGAGLAVVPWTVNAPSDIAGVLAAGVDGIVSDFPDRVVGALAARDAGTT